MLGTVGCSTLKVSSLICIRSVQVKSAVKFKSAVQFESAVRFDSVPPNPIHPFHSELFPSKLIAK